MPCVLCVAGGSGRSESHQLNQGGNAGHLYQRPLVLARRGPEAQPGAEESSTWPVHSILSSRIIGDYLLKPLCNYECLFQTFSVLVYTWPWSHNNTSTKYRNAVIILGKFAQKKWLKYIYANDTIYNYISYVEHLRGTSDLALSGLVADIFVTTLSLLLRRLGLFT